MLAHRIWTRLRSWTIDPLLWLGALLCYFALIQLIKIVTWWQHRRDR